MLWALAICGVARAEGTVPGQSSTSYTGTVFTYSAQGVSAAAVCSDAMASASAAMNNPGNKYVMTLTGSSETTCSVSYTYQSCNANPNSSLYGTCDSPSNGTTTGSVSKSIVYTCPAHSTGSSTCTCDAGYSPGSGALTGFCVPPTICPVGSTYSTGWYNIGSDITMQPTAGCTGGCAYAYDGFSASKWTLSNGVKQYWAQGTYTSTGGKCGGGNGDPTNAPVPPSAASSPAPSTCPAGQALGSVNGNPVCASTGSPSPPSGQASGVPDTSKSTATSGTTVSNNADGSVTKVTTTTTTAADGTKSTSVTTTTTATTGAVTSTTVTTGGSGSSGSGSGTGTTGTGAGAGCSNGQVSCDGGGEMPEIGTLYTKKDKTFDDVFAQTKTEFMAAPAIQDVSGFFAVSNAGTCPQSTWHIPYLNADVTFDFFCNTTAGQMFSWMRAAVALVGLVFAFRIAFL